MDLTGTARIPAPPTRVFAEVADLSTYPQWLGIVHAAESVAEGAWVVELGARLGPFRRTKRVRMVQTVSDPPVRARFERVEEDGRPHSPWVLDVEVAPDGEGTHVAVHLHYGGGAWLPGLDVVLRQEVRRAGGRLAQRF